MKKPFAIRLVAQDTHGSTYERVYVRPVKSKQKKDAFVAWAIGDLLMLISEGEFHALREYVIVNMAVLTPEEAYAFWVKDAEAEIERQTEKARKYVADYFQNYPPEEYGPGPWV